MFKRIIPYLILLIVILACSGTQPGAIPTPIRVTELPESVPPPTLAATSSPTLIPTPTLTPTPTPDPIIQIGEVYIIPDVPALPSDYLEVFEGKVKSGEWTHEQGLTTLLKIFTGELASAETLGNFQPQTPEIGGIIALASEYLDNGSDAAVKDEIQRLLNILIPTPEQLLPYAQPQPETPSFNPDSVVMASFNPSLNSYQDETCEDLSSRGFPPGGSTVCIQYTEATLVNGTGTVYYPVTWWPSDPKLAYVLAATEAMVRSAQVFSQFGQTASVDLVFGMINAAGDKPPLAVAPFDKQENCLIVMYPDSIAIGQQRGMPYFQQVVAHEMFHCLQHWNVPAMQQSGYDANQWWIEGAAEYFGNVVYPTANREWDFVPHFDKDSASKSIFDMDYQNTVFFQYLQNVNGDQAIVDFLKSIPPSADPQVSANALADYPDIQTIFHNFAQAWADKQIIDSGGAFLPNKLVIQDSESNDIGEDVTIYTYAHPFVLSRYFLRFMEDNIYNVNKSFAGPEGLEAARPADMPLVWADLPSPISAGCGNAPFIFITTSAVPGTEPRKGDLVITHEDDPNCDLCVVGSWQFNTEQFVSDFVASVYQDEDIQYQADEMTGSLTLKFTREGVYRGIYDSLLYTYSVLTPDAFGDLFGIQTSFSFTGQTYGTYQTNNQTLSVFDGLSTVVRQMGMAGNLGEPTSQSGVGFGPGMDVPYTCSETELIFEHIDGATGLPFQYHYNKQSK